MLNAFSPSTEGWSHGLGEKGKLGRVDLSNSELPTAAVLNLLALYMVPHVVTLP